MPLAGAAGFVGLTLTAGADTSGFMLGRATFEAVFPYSLSIVPLFIAMGVLAGPAGPRHDGRQRLHAFVAVRQVAVLSGVVLGGL